MRNFVPCRRVLVVLLGLLLAAADIPLRAQSSLEQEDYQYARRLFNDGLYDLAAEQFVRFVDRYPSSPHASECLYLAGEAQRRAGMSRQAAATFSRLLIEYPHSPFCDDALFALSAIEESRGAYEEAAQMLERVPVLAPRSPRTGEAYLRAGILYRRADWLDRSAESLQRCLNLPAQGKLRDEALVELARTRMAQRRPQLAVTLLHEFEGRTVVDSITAVALLELASVREWLLEFNEAGKVYEKVAASAPTRELQAMGRLGSARVALWQGNVAEALATLEPLLAETGLADTIQWRARCLAAVTMVRDGRDREALDLLRGPVDGLPPQVRVAVLAARTLVAGKAGEREAKARGATELLQLAKKDSLPEAQALALEWWLSAEPALNAVHEAIVFARRYPQFDSARGLTILAAEALAGTPGGIGKAQALLSDFLLRFPESPHVDRAAFSLAQILLRSGRVEEAKQELGALLRQYPESEYEVQARAIRDSLQLHAPSASPAALRASLGALALGPEKLSGRQLLNLARVALVAAKDYETAAALAKLAIARGTAGGDMADALRFLALAHLNRARLAEGGSEEGQEKARAHADSARLVYELLRQRFPADFSCADRALLAEAVLRGPGDPVAKMTRLSEVAADRDSTGIPRCPASAWIYARALWQLSGFGEHDSLSTEAAVVAEGVALTLNDSLASLAAQLAVQARLAAGDSSRALELCGQYADRFSPTAPRWGWLTITHADLLSSAGHYAEAAARYQSVADSRFYSTLRERALSGLVRCLVAQGRYEEALEAAAMREPTRDLLSWEPALQWLVENHNSDCERVLATARALIGLGRTREALAWLTENRLLGMSGDVHCRVALIHEEAKLSARLGNWQTAAYLLEQIWENSDLPLERRSRAALDAIEILFDNNQYRQVGELASAVWNEVSDEKIASRAAEFAIVAAFRQDALRSALNMAERFTKQFGKGRETAEARARFLYEEGEYYFRQKSFDHALKVFNRAASDFRDTEWGRRAEFAIARTHLTLNHTDKALGILTNLPQKYPDTEVERLAYLNLGVFYHQNKQLGNAIFALEQVVQDSLRAEPSTLQSAERELIRCLDEAGMWDRALIVLRDYLRRFPDADDHFDRRIQVGTMLIRVNEYDRAVDHLRSLLEEADAETKAEIQYWIGKAYLQKGDLETGIAEMLKVKYVCPPTKLPWDVTALFEAAVAYTRLGNLDRAEELFQQIVREQGSTSNFGRSALQRIQEIQNLRKRL